MKNGEKSISLGVLNYNATASSVWVEFKEESASIVLIVTLSILGALLCIGMVVAVILIARKFREDQQRVNDPENVINNNNLFARSPLLKLRPSEV